jgi:hypothetical protein
MKAVERVKRANIEHVGFFVDLIHQANGIEGVASVFKRIIERDDDQILDHLMEIKYGVLFKSLGRFHARFEPTGAEGPDLMVERDGVSAFLEVKRYRPNEGEHIPEQWGRGGSLQQYGDPLKVQMRIEKDLLCKLRQIRRRDEVEHGILAIWSDRDFFEDIEFECAVRHISPEAKEKGLRFCIFGSDWVSPRRNFCCVPVSQIEAFREWMDDIKRAPQRQQS